MRSSNRPLVSGRLKRIQAGTIFTAGAIILAACGSSSVSSPTATTSATGSTKSLSPYVIHAIVSRTGAGSVLGSREAQALQILAAQVNAKGGIDGHQIEMSIQDNQTNPATAVSLATPLISSGVPFIINGSIVAPDQAVDALVGQNGPFIYDLSPIENPSPGSMIFAAGLSLRFDAEAYLTFLKSKGLTKIAEITSTDGTGVDGYKQLVSALKLPQFSTMHLVAHQTFDPTAVNVTSQLSVIKAANPQAIVIWTTGTPLGTVLNGMSSLGMENTPTVTDNGNASHALLTHFASVLPKALYFPTPPLYLPPADITNPAVKAQVVAFDSAVTAAGGHPGNPWGLAWDPANLLIGAIKKLGVTATAKQIQNYMEHLSNVPGVFGLYNTSSSHHHGLTVSDIYMTTWNGSSFVQASGAGGTSATG